MKTRKYNSLSLEVNLSVPETNEEFDANAKRVGACLEEATNNVVYRGGLAEFRDVFLHGRSEKDVADAAKDGKTLTVIRGVEQLTGISRAVKQVVLKSKNEDGSPKTSEVYDESEADYFKRVLAKTEKKAEDFQSLANEVAASIVFDASATERKPSGPKTAPKKFVETATKIVEKGNGQALAERLSGFLGREIVLTGEKDKDIAILAMGMKDHSDAEADKQLAAFGS